MVATNAVSGGLGTNVLPFLRIPSRVTMVAVPPGPISGDRTRIDRRGFVLMHPPLLSHKAARFAESVIRGMTIEAAKYEAVNLAQGMPDFPAPAELKAAACRAIEADINQYAITWGSKNLREALAEHAAWHLGLSVDPETEITVTCGSTEAMLVALLSLINPGDEVDPVAAVLRELLARLCPGRRGSAVRPAPAAAVDLRSRRAGGLPSTTAPRRSFSVTRTIRPVPSSAAPTSKRSPRSAASGT